jgi:DNA-binding helix-hairpin-helix protein with protein kinase domain
MADFQKGEWIALSGGGYAEVVCKLGEGGQGSVYEVMVGGKPCALKWYHIGKLKKPEEFRKNIRENITSGTPSDKFLWPAYLTEEKAGSFGYIMGLRPPEYTDFPAILNAKDKNGGKVGFKSTETRILAALNLVNAFRELHRKGLSYQDLNDGNFFINLQTGGVLICDNDNVTPDGEMNSGGVGGKPGYMAPEIVTGKAHPSERTDCHSLAVVLFILFFRSGPLEGAEFNKLPCMTEKRELELFGTKPVFIYDPDDTSNRPVIGVHNNAIKLWPLFPEFFQEGFIHSFAKGMKNPQVRLPDNEWQKTLVRLRDELFVICPSCGRAVFLTNADKSAGLNCGGCGSSYSYPKALSVKIYSVPLFPGKKLYACHTVDANDDYTTVTGEVVMNKNNPSLWGIKNLSPDIWIMAAPGGEAKDVPPGGGIPIGAGVTINFKGVSGEIA